MRVVGLLLVLTGLTALAAADDGDASPTFRLSKDGYRVALEDGLALEPGGELLITRRDLEEGLGG